MWNVEQVAERFREAAETARRLPPVRVQGYFNTWPAILHEPWETYAAEDGLYRYPPDAAAIERLEETMRWVLWLTEERRHLVWLRAEERGWRTICRRLGRDRTTACRRWQKALEVVVERLNGASIGVAKVISR
jgi:hypothetical protein